MVVGQGLFDDVGGFDEVYCVVVVFFDVCSDGEDVWVEDDVLWWEVDFVDQDVVGVGVDFDFVCIGVGLFGFVECYYYCRGVIVQYFVCVFVEQCFVFFQ